MRPRLPGKFLPVLLVLLAGGCYAVTQSKIKTPAAQTYDFREGDVILQHIPGRLTSVIKNVTNSRYSHCGLVVERDGRSVIIEAVGPVKYTSIKSFLARDRRGRFTQLRPQNLTREQLRRVAAEAEKMLGKPYDIQYELDEPKIYCSELIYKAFMRGAQIEVGKKEKLGDLNWRPNADFIRYITGGEVPLERVMITPESLANNPDLKLVYTNFKPAADEPLYCTIDLVGKWRGDYTIEGLQPSHAEITLTTGLNIKSDSANSIRLVKGRITTANGQAVTIRSFTVAPFDNRRSFTAKLTDSRGIKATAKINIYNNGRALIGTWRDDKGYRGVFSLTKTE